MAKKKHAHTWHTDTKRVDDDDDSGGRDAVECNKKCEELQNKHIILCGIKLAYFNHSFMVSTHQQIYDRK